MSEKIFGDIKSMKDLNDIAQNLKDTGELDEIKILAAENEVLKEDAEKYILGKIDILVPQKLLEEDNIPLKSPTWNTVREAIKEKQGTIIKSPGYEIGGQKIKAEAEEQYKKAKGKESGEVMKAQMAPIIKYITEKCEEDSQYNALVIQPHKTWEKCYKYMMDKAKKMAASGSSGLLVEGGTILQWIDEYYLKDDKAVEEKKSKEEAEKKAKQVQQVKPPIKQEVKAPKASEKQEMNKSNQKEAEKKVEAKKGKDIDGQISFFDLMA